ncbi:MAG TPA: nucleoside hydrolase, partial [Planctomycetota bacterium]|nr:nucleoside hydrolase [Planctomycetota bacterium]
AEVFFRHNDRITFHDPLAGAVIFEPDLCTCEEGLVRVDIKSDLVAGLTVFDRTVEEKRHRVAFGVDPEHFFEHYFDIVKG